MLGQKKFSVSRCFLQRAPNLLDVLALIGRISHGVYGKVQSDGIDFEICEGSKGYAPYSQTVSCVRTEEKK